MANGDLHLLGTLYIGGVKQLNPTLPQHGGNIPAFIPDKLIEILNTDSNQLYNIRWREINIGNKKLFVSDRNLIHTISWNDLNDQNLIFGKEITIDNKMYKLRILTGGDENRAGNKGTNGNHGKLPNEWDNIIGNEGNYLGSLGSTELNNYWNLTSLYTLAQESHLNDLSRIVNRSEINIPNSWSTVPKSDRIVNRTWRPVLEVLNAAPTVTLNTPNNVTLYENDTFLINGSATDTDVGNVVNIKYQINSENARAITVNISTGAPIPFDKQLTFKGGILYDGATAVTGPLADGVSHTLKVWAEDDQGGKSADQIRTFYVVPNRAPAITVDPFTDQSGKINNDTITLSGTTSDLDGNDVVVKYRLNEGLNTEIYSGAAGPWSFDLQLKDLKDGVNTIIVEVSDTYNFKSSKTIKLNKVADLMPLAQSIQRYEIMPPAGSAQGVLLWIQRDVDQIVSADISMTTGEEQEQFVPMTLSNSAPVNAETAEDEFTFQAANAEENIIVKLTILGTGSVTLISGVLS